MITVNSRRLLFTVIFLQEIARTENHPLVPNRGAFKN